MSLHEISIVEIERISPHPNADRMEIAPIWGWQCCVEKGQFKPGDKAIYVPPDFLVPVGHPSFAFLGGEGQRRIKVKKLRGELSQGLLIEVPESLRSLPVGTDVAEAMGITRYESPLSSSTGTCITGGPSGLYCPKFDVENFQRHPDVFVPGEHVYVTEKLHGTSARFTYAPNKGGESVQFCGTRTNWMAKDGSDIRWRAFGQCPAIGEWCRKHPGTILYGEVFGQIQSLKYGAGKTDVYFAAFAILTNMEWMMYQEFHRSCLQSDIPMAPLVYDGAFDVDRTKAAAEGDSLWPGASHMAEGVVILPATERTDSQIGRVILKMVSNRYLEKAK